MFPQRRKTLQVMVRYPDEFRKANLTDNVPKMYDCISNITETNHLIFLWKKKKTQQLKKTKTQEGDKIGALFLRILQVLKNFLYFREISKSVSCFIKGSEESCEVRYKSQSRIQRWDLENNKTVFFPSPEPTSLAISDPTLNQLKRKDNK